MAGTDKESDRLRDLVERNRRVLDELRLELEQIGDQLRREHIRRARQDRARGAGPGRDVNLMCRGCLNGCKQPVSVRIHRCERYEPV